jgi:hypothetical protein
MTKTLGTERAVYEAQWEKDNALRESSQAAERLAELDQLEWPESPTLEPRGEQFPEATQNVRGGVEVDAPGRGDRAVV